jgi:glycosyltransferase involved in cell wall biosynthesis
MRLALFYGKWSSGNRGGFSDFNHLYDGRGLTGSESSFWNLVRGLAELGHQVDVFCQTPRVTAAFGANIYPIENTPISDDYQAYISWNEPDLVRSFTGGKRIVAQQLNDFNYVQPGFDDLIDWYVSPSDAHKDRMATWGNVTPSKIRPICNSINVDSLPTDVVREPNRLIYCSSPDRGLHQALQIFGSARLKKRDLELHVFYEFKNWFDVNIDQWGSANPITEMFSNRARYIAECFSRLGTNGENGLYLYGNVSNTQLAIELAKSTILLYPCDPVNWTEGFSVSTMDALSNGCIPMITPVDALGSVYKGSGAIIREDLKVENWVTDMLWVMNTDMSARRQNAREFAKNFDRKVIAKQWETFLTEVV